MSANLLPHLQQLRSDVSLGASLKQGGQHRRQASIPSSPQVLSALAGTLHTRKPSLADSPLDVSFRLYKYDSGNLARIALTDDNLIKASDAPADVWDTMTDPSAAATERDASAANVFGLSPAGLTTDPSTPKGQQKHLSGVYVMQGLPQAGATQKSRFAAREQGDSSTTDYRVFLQQEGKDISSWHDIPLRNADGTLNFVCEIPKETAAKMEVATAEAGNPIKQDIKKGKLRFYPYNINWNYGMLPQTWEDPAHTDDALGGVAGDNDPVDVVEIGSTQLQTGGVYRVKAVGAYAMIDDGELDWKIVCIRAEDPLADKINDIEDVERELPGELERIMVWFRDYKIPDGKPPNAFGYDSKPMNSEFAEMVIAGTHNLYQGLKDGTRVNDKDLALA